MKLSCNAVFSVTCISAVPLPVNDRLVWLVPFSDRVTPLDATVEKAEVTSNENRLLDDTT